MMKAPAKADGVEEQFATRIDKIRVRFAYRLAEKLEQTDAALSQMMHDGGGVDAIATAYRWFHDVSGIGPTLGFVATGNAARKCADILVDAFRSHRSLLPDELASLNSAFDSLRIEALRETLAPEAIQRSSL